MIYRTWKLLELDNGFVRRSFRVRRRVFRTSEFLNLSSGTNLVVSESPEFSLSISGKTVTTEDFRYTGFSESGDANRNELEIALAGEDLEITLHYEIYRKYPLVRKWMILRNLSKSDLVITDLCWEKLNLRVSGEMMEDVWTYYFTRKSKSAAVDMDDCAICVNDESKMEGFIIANEAPGCMKRLEVYQEGNTVSAMFNRSEETPFERILSPGENFKTPESFILLYSGKKWQDVIDQEYHKFIEEHLTLMDASDLPSLIFNNWYPFEGDVNRNKLLEQIDAAAELGFDMYQMDHGWSNCFGDWTDDAERFPNGFEEIAEYVGKRGMKLGMWISLPAVDRESVVAKEHPDWIMKDRDGNPWHMEGWDSTYNMCLASDFRWYLIEKIDEIIKKYDVSLMKYDLSSVRNAYRPHEHAGCYTEGHYHKTPGESYFMIYEGIFDVFKELKRRNLNCIMDLTFELYNVLDGMDLALVKVADMNWFTNQDNISVRSSPWRGASFRRAVYTRGRVVPSYTLNFSACSLDHPTAAQYGIFSVLTSHALFCGDLSKLFEDEMEYYKRWFSWIKKQRRKNDFYRYYKVSDVFPVPGGEDPLDRRFEAPEGGSGGHVDEPNEGVFWDGVAKVNERGEGPIIFFRPENCDKETQSFRIPWALEKGKYRVWDQNEEKLLGNFDGKRLHEEGLEITIDKCPGGKVIVFSLVKASGKLP